MSIRARFYLALCVAALTIAVHVGAESLYLYWTFRLIDIPIHMMGGVMAGLFGLTGLRYFKQKEALGSVLLFALAVGITWELMELLYKAQDINTYYYFDTAKDLVDDLIGGCLALLLWNRLPEPKSGL